MTHKSASKRLLKIAPPPSDPVDAGSPGSWDDIENKLGLALPSDYKWLIDTYGSGEFGDFFVPLNAFSTRQGMNLLHQVDPLLNIYREGREVGAFAKQCPFKTCPEPGGFLPLGCDLNGGDMFWLTEGRPAEWPLIHYNWRGGYIHQRHAKGLVAFLARWLSGELPDSFFGVGNSPNIKRNPVFCPSGQVRSVDPVSGHNA